VCNTYIAFKIDTCIAIHVLRWRDLDCISYECLHCVWNWSEGERCTYASYIDCIGKWVLECCSVLQCVAVCCSVLQCVTGVAVCCSVLQGKAHAWYLCCIGKRFHSPYAGRSSEKPASMLQCVAMCCGAL